MQLQIQNNIPLPNTKISERSLKIHRRYAIFKDMQVGDSVMINRFPNETFSKTLTNVRSYLKRTYPNRKFSFRTMEVGKVFGVWIVSENN